MTRHSAGEAVADNIDVNAVAAGCTDAQMIRHNVSSKRVAEEEIEDTLRVLGHSQDQGLLAPASGC
ncbi:MAG: hypothetical protein ACOC6F_01605 [bacterium]